MLVKYILFLGEKLEGVQKAQKDITFYDASYIYPAVANEWMFVTEDTELRNKVSTEVRTLTAKQVRSKESGQQRGHQVDYW